MNVKYTTYIFPFLFLQKNMQGEQTMETILAQGAVNVLW